jgi:hypothetical protein
LLRFARIAPRHFMRYRLLDNNTVEETPRLLRFRRIYLADPRC